MKKAYEKPNLLIENFTMTQSIAQACSHIIDQDHPLGHPTYHSIQTCGWEIGGVILWVNNPDVCNSFHKEDAIVDGLCYNNPASAISVFGSV